MLQDCDKTQRVQLLEEIMNSLLLENERLRRGGSLSSFAPRPPPVRSVRAVYGETGGLFSHPQQIRAHAAATRVGTQQIEWAEQQSGPCAEPCVYFFRKGERVSPSELDRITTFCTGAAICDATGLPACA